MDLAPDVTEATGVSIYSQHSPSDIRPVSRVSSCWKINKGGGQPLVNRTTLGDTSQSKK